MSQPATAETLDSGSRGRLLRAALHLLAVRGYAAVGIREVAAEADLTTGAAYHHFGSKEALFRAAVEYYAHRAVSERPVLPAASGSVAEQPPVGEQLSAVVDWLAGGQEGWQRDLGVVVSTRIRWLPEFADVYERLQPAFLQLVRDPIVAGVERGELLATPTLDADALAWSFTAALVGTLEMYARDVLGMPLQQALQAQLAIFLRGVRA